MILQDGHTLSPLRLDPLSRDDLLFTIEPSAIGTLDVAIRYPAGVQQLATSENLGLQVACGKGHARPAGLHVDPRASCRVCGPGSFNDAVGALECRVRSGGW